MIYKSLPFGSASDCTENSHRFASLEPEYYHYYVFSQATPFAGRGKVSSHYNHQVHGWQAWMLLWPIRSALFMDCIQCDGAANRYLRPTVLQFLSTNQLARRTFSLSTWGFQAMLPQTDYACFWTIKSELSAGLLWNKCQLTSQRWANSCPRMVFISWYARC